MFKYPKARAVGFSLLVFVLLTFPGCCTCRERYDPFLTQVKENLEKDVRPKYKAALEKTGRPKDLVENDLGLLDDTIDSLGRVIGKGPPEEKGEKGGAK